VAQLASALAWGARGRPFKSDHPDKELRGRFICPFFIVKQMFTVYIIYSSVIDKFYTGQTQDIERRLEEHNRGKTSFSAKGMPWTLVFSKECSSRSEALKLEKLIKKRGAARFLNDNKIPVG